MQICKLGDIAKHRGLNWNSLSLLKKSDDANRASTESVTKKNKRMPKLHLQNACDL